VIRPLTMLFAAAAALAASSCRSSGPTHGTLRQPPSILLVTLDTTRADAIGPDAIGGVATPGFNALVARGRRFTHAYAPVPETLPAHASMFTGLYPGGHRVHENGRHLSSDHPTIAERLKRAGYQTTAVVSSFVLAAQFGLSRGFDKYDDALPPGAVERNARETTDRAMAHLAQASPSPMFLWVHYFDPHAPYASPEPFRTRHRARPYLGEVEAMDEQLGRLVDAFEARAGRSAVIVVAGDHGEGLGDHGEALHGYLLYQSTMRVPLVMVGPGVEPAVIDAPVSTRQIFHTLADWAGLDATESLRGPPPPVVLGEAMKPHLQFGWQPQIMAVEGRQKAILAGRVEIYDVVADPHESRDLSRTAGLPPPVSPLLREYPVPAREALDRQQSISEADRQKLASLGYASGSAAPLVRKDAPRPADMTRLFEVIDAASALFAQGRYAEAVPVLQKIIAADPTHLDAVLRLATSYSMLGRHRQALDAFARARALAPRSTDVQLYLALHHARGTDWRQAVPVLERIVADAPQRVAALEGLAAVRERQGRSVDAIALRQRVHALQPPTPAELVRLGELAMAAEQTITAIEAFERARALDSPAFRHDLELGVLYLAARRLPEARAALDRVPARHPGYPMALFKRAQVSVLIGEPDRAARIALARRHADRTTRPLIESEKLFRDAR
jgi:arylsulfatase A-like enzyme/Tfp pilus assembly protein PilF